MHWYFIKLALSLNVILFGYIKRAKRPAFFRKVKSSLASYVRKLQYHAMKEIHAGIAGMKTDIEGKTNASGAVV